MFRLATTAGLAGFVRNDIDGVWLEIEGERERVDGFIEELPRAIPRTARIDRLEIEPLEPKFHAGFSIVPSALTTPGRAAAEIPADVAPCEECLAELFDPDGRRHHYPFINCTVCGPRYTIVGALPYDRSRTTMAVFEQCEDCRREYESPGDRRFHAEPNACPTCGPTLAFFENGAPEGGSDTGERALAAAARAVRDGRVVALKGVGGFALAVDALSEPAVSRLRTRKQRPDKPFAVMARDLDHAERVVILDDAARAALCSPARPIVLARARPDCPLAPSVAPRLTEVGIFLPPTPLQALLAVEGPPLQVMTSGNAVGAPLAATNDEARAQLRDIADAFLVHDRDIHARADDSVVRSCATGIIPVRRARGTVPERFRLPFDAPPLLAVGGGYKSTVCIAAGGSAVVSAHIGDLDHVATAALFENTVSHLTHLLGIEPEFVVHDLHPDYCSTQWARDSGIPCIAVQHHHAHAAACLAEHGRTEETIAVVFDGTGLGADRTLWGGEFLIADLGGFRRIGHLTQLPLPGGEAAIRTPAKTAVAALLQAGLAEGAPAHLARWMASVRRVASLPQVSPLSSSAGRWFDAMAALCEVRETITYDGQAAMELEALAADGVFAPYDAPVEDRGPTFVVNLLSAVRAVVRERARGVPVPETSARFHETLAVAVRDGCEHIRARGGPNVVALTGGCFQNRRLVERATALLEANRFEVLLHRRVPPNDGGLSLGQAAIGAHRARREA
jgi:hydrogenase maturation protein HypF